MWSSIDHGVGRSNRALTATLFWAWSCSLILIIVLSIGYRGDRQQDRVEVRDRQRTKALHVNQVNT